MRLLPLLTALSLLLIILVFSCSPDDEAPMEESSKECYRCTFSQILPNDCDSLYVNEICVIGPHQSSLQMVLEITEKCNGEIMNTSEEIRFLEDILAEQQAAGASCEEF